MVVNSPAAGVDNMMHTIRWSGNDTILACCSSREDAEVVHEARELQAEHVVRVHERAGACKSTCRSARRFNRLMAERENLTDTDTLRAVTRSHDTWFKIRDSNRYINF